MAQFSPSIAISLTLPSLIPKNVYFHYNFETVLSLYGHAVFTLLFVIVFFIYCEHFNKSLEGGFLGN